MFKLINLTDLRKSPIVKSIGIYTFSNFFAKGASFLLLFIFTNPRYILPSENGLLSLFSNSLLFLIPFVSMGIIHSTSADFYKLNKQEFRSFFTTGFIMPVIVTVLSAGVLFLFRDYLQKTYLFPPVFTWIIPAVTFLSLCIEQLLNLARNNNEPVTFLKVNMTRTILELGLSFILVVFFAWRWEGRVAGILISYSCIGVYAFWYFKKKGYLFGPVKKQYLLEELVYAVPIIAMQVSIFSMTASDKFFLSNFTSDKNETVGIYSIACVFSSVIIVFSGALLQYLFPKIYKLLSSADIDYRSIKKHFYFYLLTLVVVALVIIGLTPLVYKYFINQKYHSALGYSYLLVCGYFLWSVTYFFYSFLLYHKQKRKILLLSICCILVSLLCNYFFIKQWHQQGAAIGVFTCYFIVLILTLIFTKEYWQKFIFLPEKVKPGL